jgi:hypothetical protein
LRRRVRVRASAYPQLFRAGVSLFFLRIETGASVHGAELMERFWMKIPGFCGKQATRDGDVPSAEE